MSTADEVASGPGAIQEAGDEGGAGWAGRLGHEEDRGGERAGGVNVPLILGIY